MLVDDVQTLDFPADEEVTLHFILKSWNGYPPYDPEDYPYHMDMVRNETLIVEAIPKGLGYNVEYQYSEFSSNTEIVDIIETDTHYLLFFRQDLNASIKEVIDVYAKLSTYPEHHREESMKINDGARFVYRQIAVGPSRYEVLDTHVQAVMGISNDLEVSKWVAPVQIGTYGDEIFNFIEIKDLFESQELEDPYIKSLGFGNITATTYIGGRINKTLLYSRIDSCFIACGCA